MKKSTLPQSLRNITIKIVLALTVLLSLIPFAGHSTHIIGGELNYKCLGGNQYQITLIVYRDCYNGVPPFDNPAAVGIFDVNNKLVTTVYLNFPGSTKVPPTLAQTNPCVQVPTNICTEVAKYVGTVTLPPRAGGYQLAYQRCCRNSIISNLVNPGNTGATYYAHIPDQAVSCNSNPVYKNYPPLFICVNNQLTFDHSATDFEGDSIVYSMCTPLDGATGTNSEPQPPNAPPYNFVTFKSPYSSSDPMGGIPLKIDPKTGILTGTPNKLGTYVIGVCADEYRNGVYISTTKRDFQFNVVDCQPDVAAAAASYVSDCTNHTVTFTNKSTGATKFSWTFGDLTKAPADTSNLTNPTWTYPKQGTYTVKLIAFSNKSAACNDTIKLTVVVDTCKPCGMTLGVTKTDASCGVGGPCTTVPPVLDTKTGKTIGAGNPPADSTTLSWSHTVTAGGLNRLLVVQLSSMTVNAVSVTYAGLPLTLLSKSTNGNFNAEMWYLIAPPTGTSMVLVTYPPGSGTFYPEKRGESFSFTGVDQVTPFNTPTSTTGSACPATFTIASGANELVLDMIVKDYFYKPATAAPQTQQYSLAIAFNPACAASLQPGAAPNVTSTWNWTFCGTYPWAAVGASIKPACAGGATLGSATVTETGGTAPFTYSWNTTPAQTTPTATNLPAGTYIVTVSGAGNCIQTASVIIDAISTMSLTPTQTNPSTCGASDGSASVSPVTGNSGPVTYQWTPNVSSGPTATGLPAGTYTVKVVDSAGCSKSNTFTLGQATLITVTATKTDVRCKNGTGTATASTPTGGIGPYTYSWSTSPVQNTQTATGLQPGYYVVTATDAGGCSGTAAVTVSDSSLALTSSFTNVKCFGGTSGTATVSATLGTPPYTYSWNTVPVQNTATATGLKAGTYVGKVVDNAGCTDSVIVTLTQPLPLNPEPKNTSTVTCAGSQTGSATVFVSGGVAPYSLQWCNGQTTPNVTGLPQGKCSITVTDSNNCVVTDTVNIIFPPALSVTAISTNIKCHGGNDGGATVNPAGGQAPYSYLWSPTAPVQINQTASSLTAGTYTVTVTDAAGCTATTTVTITEPSAVSLTMGHTDVTCMGLKNGTASVTATGGTPTYKYSWNSSPVQTTPTATGLPGGTYIVTVTDNAGCVTNSSVVVLDVNPLPVASFTVTAMQPTCKDGVQVAFVNTSTSATTYLWIFPNGTTTDKDPAPSFPYGTNGTVKLVAFGLGGSCSDTATMNININPFSSYITPEVPNVFTPNGDGINDCFEVKVGNGLENCVQLTIFDRWGLKLYDNANGVCWDGRTTAGKAVPSGTYYYLIKIGDDSSLHGSLTLLR